MKGVQIISEDELSVPPLTEKEIKWIERLQRTLMACPDRLDLVTIGDPALDVISNEKESSLFDGNAAIDGVVLAIVSGKPQVHGVSG